ncbi:MAG TPA: alkaline phosphatase family protein [Stellaceae bacterium]|nr:alkaline phosphatase family protein [Stellaceae bacterium]
MPKIDHVVVVMLENRSFDNLLGRLYPKSDRFDGLDGTETNPWHKPDGSVEQIGVWNSPEITSRAACMPSPDPGELFSDFNEQIFGQGTKPSSCARMTGFVDNYCKQPPQDGPADPRAVMHYFLPTQVPVISQLAKAFGVSDRWHASAPCETWPNRYFLHAGRGGGYVNNERSRFPHRWPRTMRTIFRRLDARGYSWKIYFHDLPQTATLVDLWLKIPTHFCQFEAEFERHANTGRLPNYSFIEPRYYPSRLLNKVPNDQHPPHNMLYGEQLIAAVYNAVRSAPTWPRTLLVVTYDEHGGCFDHVPPPPAVSPGGPYPDGFAFDRYGVRVPAVVISPYVAPGSVIRPPPRPDGRPSLPFDHCSIQATLHKLFDLGPPLTPRVAAAPDLLGALTLRGPENNGPEHIMAEQRLPSAAEIRAHRRLPRNRHQRNLRSPALGLPAAVAGIAAGVRGLGAKMLPNGWQRR